MVDACRAEVACGEVLVDPAFARAGEVGDGDGIRGDAQNAESTGHIITSFDDATIPLDSYLWAEIDAVSGTVDIVQITIFYDVD